MGTMAKSSVCGAWWQRMPTWTRISLLMVLLAGGVALGLFLRFFTVLMADLRHFDDAGPFSGVVIRAPTGKPDSAVGRNGLVIECYQHSQGAPIIVSRRDDGPAVGAWEVAVPEEIDGKKVRIYQCTLDAMRRARDGYNIRHPSSKFLFR